MSPPLKLAIALAMLTVPAVSQPLPHLRPGHPRLYGQPEEIERVKRLVQSNKLAAQWLLRIQPEGQEQNSPIVPLKNWPTKGT